MKRIGFLLIVLMSLAVGCSATASVDGWAIYEDDKVYFEYPAQWVDLADEYDGFVDAIFADINAPSVPSVNLVMETSFYMMSADEIMDDAVRTYEGGIPGLSDFKLHDRGKIQVGNTVAGYLIYEVRGTQVDDFTEQMQVIVPKLNKIYYFTFGAQKGYFESEKDTFFTIIDTIKIK